MGFNQLISSFLISSLVCLLFLSCVELENHAGDKAEIDWVRNGIESLEFQSSSGIIVDQVREKMVSKVLNPSGLGALVINSHTGEQIDAYLHRLIDVSDFRLVEIDVYHPVEELKVVARLLPDGSLKYEPADQALRGSKIYQDKDSSRLLFLNAHSGLYSLSDETVNLIDAEAQNFFVRDGELFSFRGDVLGWFVASFDEVFSKNNFSFIQVKDRQRVDPAQELTQVSSTQPKQLKDYKEEPLFECWLESRDGCELLARILPLDSLVVAHPLAGQASIVAVAEPHQKPFEQSNKEFAMASSENHVWSEYNILSLKYLVIESVPAFSESDDESARSAFEQALVEYQEPIYNLRYLKALIASSDDSEESVPQNENSKTDSLR